MPSLPARDGAQCVQWRRGACLVARSRSSGKWRESAGETACPSPTRMPHRCSSGNAHSATAGRLGQGTFLPASGAMCVPAISHCRFRMLSILQCRAEDDVSRQLSGTRERSWNGSVPSGIAGGPHTTSSATMGAGAPSARPASSSGCAEPISRQSSAVRFRSRAQRGSSQQRGVSSSLTAFARSSGWRSNTRGCTTTRSPRCSRRLGTTLGGRRSSTTTRRPSVFGGASR